ncbi:MAG: trans-2-enoyl-CoA reductase family protein [Treponema sp.]|jgi:enoyl-[acyl-carrier protein] reductase/trans-2-enoyl-CoA reductase (NAD+)|nr:trans-2-enoyl-CoA reductase family protein [Treponema sp.]
MIIKPMIRNNICINSHPAGCAAVVRRQIGYVKKTLAPAGVTAGGKFSPETRNSLPAGSPRLVLVVGCSTGYGLASRICAAFGYGAATVGISLERPGTESKPGTPGYYNNLAFDREAEKAGLACSTLEVDAFSDAAKARAAEAVRETAKAAGLPPQADLVIYSLASPVRTDPKDGITYRSVIKPIGKSYSGKTIDMMSAKFITAAAEPATEEEAAHTVKVMGGEDWELWIDALDGAGVLSPAARTVAYTYIGPELSWAIYKNGTIGRAKSDLERACRRINKKFGGGGEPGKGRERRAWVSVNKALVTRASAVIPIIPFYVSCLFKVMKEMDLHEGCVEQITRLYRDRLYAPGAAEDPAAVPVDGEGRIRIDDREMREDVQKAVLARMALVTDDNILSATDVAGFRHDFLEVHGFDVEGIDYDRDVDPSGKDI